jgi:hypothetical protein
MRTMYIIVGLMQRSSLFIHIQPMINALALCELRKPEEITGIDVYFNMHKRNI